MLKMRLFSAILLACAVLFTSCKKDDDPSISEGDVFIVDNINKEDIKGWTLTNGSVEEATTQEMGDLVNDDAFTVDIDDETGARLEFKANNKVDITQDGETDEADYVLNGSNLSISAMIQGFTFTFPFELDGNNIKRRSYSDLDTNADRNFTFSSSGNPWYAEAENDLKEGLTEEGDLVMFLEYEVVYKKQ